MPTYDYELNDAYSESIVTNSTGIDSSGINSGTVILYLLLMLLVTISMWKTFKKAGKPGWTIFVPIYGQIVMLKIAHLPVWHLFLFFVPIVNFFIVINTMIKFAKAYGKSTGFGIGLLLLPMIFYPILAFGKSQYVLDDTTKPSDQNPTIIPTTSNSSTSTPVTEPNIQITPQTPAQPGSQTQIPPVEPSAPIQSPENPNNTV